MNRLRSLTEFREDLGIWLRREHWPRENKRWQPKCMGVNMKGYRWTGWRNIVRRDRRHVVEWLWIRTHPQPSMNSGGERK